jgi:nicotinamidase/pyrazinamidase
MNALVLVDLQKDFMPGGALAVPDGDAVVTVANRLAGQFDLVIATKDWHPRDHGSFITAHPGKAVGDLATLGGMDQVVWPVHCVQESPGAEFHDDLDAGAINEVIVKGTDPGIDSYSGFFDNGHRQATGLQDVLEAHGVDRIYLMGLATDYCVKYTALDARRLGLETMLIVDGCRGVDLAPGDVERALEEMGRAGVTLVSSDDVPLP